MNIIIILLNYSTTKTPSIAVNGGHFGEEGMGFPWKKRKLAAKAYKKRKLAAKAYKKRKFAAKKAARKHRKHHAKRN
ncbi:hypothetical protein Y032_0006g3148 [Ancylostoma ceylanicum]|uniref:Uncharacterized protein n=1 Tax=Ancylostoma ceylanicum TaxID=53326 RepID=A0A016VRP9_9BILA|nr:hypothetical protein Y032_0006g3148 [Ancylostoma ceylanicum]